MYKTLFRTVAPHISTLTVTDNEITADSIIDVYTDNNEIYASGISVSDNTLTVTFDGTLSGANVAIAVNNIEGALIIPDKTSQLQNDSGFITLEDIPPIPTKTSDLENDSGYITIEDVPSAQDEYKLTEHIVGKYTDGRNVYSITIPYTFSSIGSGTTTLHTFSEDVTLLNYEGFMKNSSTNVQYILPYSNGNNTTTVIMNNKRDLCTRINNDSWGSVYSPLTVTAFYLKDSEVV